MNESELPVNTDTIEETSGLPGWLSTLIFILIVVAVCWVLLRVIKKVLRHSRKGRQKLGIQSSRLETFHQVIYSAIRVVLIIIALLLILDSLGVNTSSLLAAAGIGGIAIAFGAQRLVADVFSGLFILLDGTYSVGDFVSLTNGVSGTVVEMNIRQTIVQDYTGIIHTFPNSEITIIANYGHSPELQCDVKVEVPNRLPLDRALDLLEEVSKEVDQANPGMFHKAPYFVGTEDLGTLTYTIQIGAQTDVDQFWKAQRVIRGGYLRKLQKEDVYAFPPELELGPKLAKEGNGHDS